MKQIIIDFLKRFIQDNPRAAKVVQLLLLLLMFLPYVLEHFNIGNPQLIEILTNDIVRGAETIGIAIFQFPNKKPKE